MQLPSANIIQLIPQRRPFVLITELLEVTDNAARSRFLIEAEHVLIEQGYLTEAGLVENMAQTAAAKAGYDALTKNKLVANGFITMIKQLEVVKLPLVGEELTTEIKIIDQIFNTTLIAGQTWCNGEPIAACEMNVLTETQEEGRLD